MEFIVSGTQFILILRDSGRREGGERESKQESLPTSSFMVLVLCPSCCGEINQAGLTRLAHLQLLFDTLSLLCYKVCLAYLSPVSSTWHTGFRTEMTVKQCSHCDIQCYSHPKWGPNAMPIQNGVHSKVRPNAHCSKIGPIEEKTLTLFAFSMESIIKWAPVLWWSRVHIKVLESVAKSAPLQSWSIMGPWNRDPQCHVKNQVHSKVRLSAVLIYNGSMEKTLSMLC